MVIYGRFDLVYLEIKPLAIEMIRTIEMGSVKIRKEIKEDDKKSFFNILNMTNVHKNRLSFRILV
jgi:hypothetical protein